MRIHVKKKLFAGILFVAMLVSVLAQSTIESHAIKSSKTNYIVKMKGISVFLGNEIPGNSEIGTEYFMTYTVKKVVEAAPEQQGLVSTGDRTARYPYEDGGFIRWTVAPERTLFKEGSTYFIKCTIAEGGFTYEITRMDGENANAIVLEEYWGYATAKTKYIGVWIAGNAEMELTNVRCYDTNGQDMGVAMTEDQGEIIKDVEFPKNTRMEHTYDITVTDAYCVALSNLRAPTTEKMYMEYTVESSDLNICQEGIILSNYPNTMYPFQKGVMRYDNYIDGTDAAVLLDEGASYIICFERAEGKLRAVIQKIKDGTRSYLSFSEYAQLNVDAKANYFSLWFGDWEKYRASFHLKDFKCYDENNNNLAVQCNTKASIKHYGPIEDYAKCEAAYYCKKNGNMFALYENQTLLYTEKRNTKEGKYKIVDNVMTAQFEDEKVELDYLYQQITDSEGNQYNRLHNYTVTFETWGNAEIPSQELSNKTGFVVMKPEDPEVEGKEFEAWVTGDGQEFDFDNIVTESTTLYAKYVGEKLPTLNNGTNLILPIAGIIVLLGLVVVLVIYLRKRGNKHGCNMEK